MSIRGSAFAKIALLMALALFSLNLLFRPRITSIREQIYPTAPPSSSPRPSTSDPHCARLPGAEDVLVVIKTGATELQSKLPVHLNTTTTCYPDTLIFSDYAEELPGGIQVHDALSLVNESIRLNHPDFALWRRLHFEGRATLQPHELSGPMSSSGGVGGKTANQGWRLDKWKFLPMVKRSLELYPHKQWFVFAETDTYIVWSNLLSWLNLLSPEIDIYAGFQMQIGDQVFAHGGSGFVVSAAAMRVVVEYVARDPEWWESYTDAHWAGDCVLGKAFEEAGSPLLWSWPLIMGDKPSTIDFFRENFGAGMWCRPVVTYHHLAADEIEPMWRIEQEWVETHADNEPLRQKDMFKQHILPHLATEKRHWDNLSGDLTRGTNRNSLHECRELCQSQDGCMQYRLARGKCMTSPHIKLGEAAAAEEQVLSGWMKERIDEVVRIAEQCDVGATGNGYITQRIVEGKQRAQQ